MNWLTKHIPDAQLADYAEQLSAAEERLAVQQHLAVCELCRQQAGLLTKMVRLMRNDPVTAAPAGALEWAAELFRTRAARPQAPLLKRLVASLVGELTPLNPAFGERSAAAGLQQFLYRAEAHEIDVQILPHEQGWQVLGQILGPHATGGAAELQGPETAAQALLNELQEFAFEPLPAGAYTLWLRWPDREIEVPDIVLQP